MVGTRNKDAILSKEDAPSKGGKMQNLLRGMGSLLEIRPDITRGKARGIECAPMSDPVALRLAWEKTGREIEAAGKRLSAQSTHHAEPERTE